MGNVIAFWGASPGQTGNSSSLIAASAVMAMDYVSRILTAHTRYDRSILEAAFYRPQRTVDSLSGGYSAAGIDSLEILARSGQLTPTLVRDYALPVFSDSLDILPGTRKPDQEMFLKLHEVAAPICEAMQSAYDLSMIDTTSGAGHVITQKVLEAADLVVISLNQNMHVLREFFEQPPAVLQHKKTVIVIGQYDGGSRMTVNNIRRIFKTSIPIFAVPHNSGYMDACNEHKVVEYFLKRKHIQRDHPDYALMQEVRRLNKGIFTALGLDHQIFAKEA